MAPIGAAADSDQPVYHVGPPAGWTNDPNGPIFYEGRYHLFYQHVPTGCEWSFGLVWGHAVSTDLVTWVNLPPALAPTAGTVDADGCFSGCALTANGVPTLLYTGVRKRSNPDCGPLPPDDCDLHLPFIESQCAAVGTPGDSMLTSFSKLAEPIIPLPPANMNLMGWRDPFVLSRNLAGPDGLSLVIGSGIRNEGGAVLLYRSDEATAGWKYCGIAARGTPDMGDMWECPLLIDIPVSFSAAGCGNQGSCNEPAHMLCISPDNPGKSVIFWLGHYDGSYFDVAAASGPHRLDLGDTVYAPNCLHDPQGRLLLWGWLQERRKKMGTYTYAGCLSVPRVLTVRDGRLHQEPADELAALRQPSSVNLSNVKVLSQQPVRLEGITGAALDLEVEIQRGDSYLAGIHIRSWAADTEAGVALLVDWSNSTLQAVFEGLNPETGAFGIDSPGARSIGGAIDVTGDAVRLRLLLDHSAVEVFTGCGQVLSTRVYRGVPTDPNDCGVDLVALGGDAKFTSVNAWTMSSAWVQPEVAVEVEDWVLVEKKLAELEVDGGMTVAEPAVMAAAMMEQQPIVTIAA